MQTEATALLSTQSGNQENHRVHSIYARQKTISAPLSKTNWLIVAEIKIYLSSFHGIYKKTPGSSFLTCRVQLIKKTVTASGTFFHILY
jgi:hypothetical protein